MNSNIFQTGLLTLNFNTKYLVKSIASPHSLGVCDLKSGYFSCHMTKRF